MKLLIFLGIKIMRLLSWDGGQNIFITTPRSPASLLLTQKKQLIFVLETKTLNFLNSNFLIGEGERLFCWCKVKVKPAACRCMWVLRLYWLLYVLLQTAHTAWAGTQARLWYRDMWTLSECSFFISRWQCWQDSRSSHNNPATYSLVTVTWEPVKAQSSLKSKIEIICHCFVSRS